MRLADRQHVGTRRDQRPGDRGCGDGLLGHGEDVVAGAILVPAVDGREAVEDTARLGERGEGPDRERLGEQPLAEPGLVFGGLAAVDGWREDGASSYVLDVSDSAVAAPLVTRALVAAGADVLSIGESRHSLEDVYLELIGEDEEAERR